MKVFFDTNVLVAAYATHGACNELLHHCIARHKMYTSDFVLHELTEKLLHRIKLTSEETALIIHFLRRVCIVAAQPSVVPHISKDHDDDRILASAIDAQVDCLVSGDSHMLVLKKVSGVQIVKPADFWKLELMKDVLR